MSKCNVNLLHFSVPQKSHVTRVTSNQVHNSSGPQIKYVVMPCKSTVTKNSAEDNEDNNTIIPTSSAKFEISNPRLYVWNELNSFSVIKYCWKRTVNQSINQSIQMIYVHM